MFLKIKFKLKNLKMLSIETERIISKFLITLLEEESKIQRCKDELINNCNFNPYQCFTYINNIKDTIDNNDIYNFMNLNSINITLDESYLIILYFDIKSQNFWYFDNFIIFLINNYNILNNNKRLNFTSNKVQITDIIKQLLLNIFKAELQLIHKTIPLVNQIKKRYDYNINDLFKALSFNKNNINTKSLDYFLIRNGYCSNSDMKLNSIITRLSLSKSDIVTFSDLQRLFEIGYCNKGKSDLYISMFNCPKDFINVEDKNEINEDINSTWYISNRDINSYRNNNSTNKKKDYKRKIISDDDEYKNNDIIIYQENEEEKINTPKKYNINQINNSNYINSEIPEEKFFVDYLLYISGNEVLIEQNKCKLALKYDFNIEDCIRIFKSNESKEQYLSQNDFIKGTQSLELKFDKEEIKLLFCRYDLMNNGYLTYDDFYNMIVPYDSKYREMVERRKQKGKISETTQNYLKDLLQCMCISEISIEKERNKLMKYLNDMSLNKIFDKMDINKKGTISKKDLLNYLKSFNINIFDNNIDLLFNRLDRDKDGIINLNDIIMEISIILTDEIINF